MTKDKALDLALEALEHMLEDAKQERLTVEYWNECVDAITAIKQARSAPVQEPAIKQGWDVDTLLDKPAAQRPVALPHKWVGLTRQDIDIALDDTQEGGGFDDFAHAIEAKLKEKNESHRQHVTDGSPCWCEPETSYTDPETGASVIVHKEPQ